jgi:hypothetical protein
MQGDRLKRRRVEVGGGGSKAKLGKKGVKRGSNAKCNDMVTPLSAEQDDNAVVMYSVTVVGRIIQLSTIRR